MSTPTEVGGAVLLNYCASRCAGAPTIRDAQGVECSMSSLSPEERCGFEVYAELIFDDWLWKIRYTTKVFGRVDESKSRLTELSPTEAYEHWEKHARDQSPPKELDFHRCFPEPFIVWTKESRQPFQFDPKGWELYDADDSPDDVDVFDGEAIWTTSEWLFRQNDHWLLLSWHWHREAPHLADVEVSFLSPKGAAQWCVFTKSRVPDELADASPIKSLSIEDVDAVGVRDTLDYGSTRDAGEFAVVEENQKNDDEFAGLKLRETDTIFLEAAFELEASRGVFFASNEIAEHAEGRGQICSREQRERLVGHGLLVSEKGRGVSLTPKGARYVEKRQQKA